MKKLNVAFKPLAVLAIPALLTACMSTDGNNGVSVTQDETWFCGDLQVQSSTEVGADTMELHVQDRSIPLNLVIAASGSKYQSANKPHTIFWTKGNEAYFELDGKRMPTCYAEGHVPEKQENALEQGLHDKKWQVRSINGEAIDTDAAHFSFLTDGRVVGHGGCNSFFGQYQVAGNTVSFGQVGATRMACEPELMSIEDNIFAIFGEVSEVSLDGDSAVIIRAGDKHLRAVAF